MADTTYAVVADLRNMVSVPNTAQDAVLQRYLNAAASVVDKMTRNPPQGTEAFSLTNAGVVRYFDDILSDRGVAHIHDCQAVTLVKRGTLTVDSAYYKLGPYNANIGYEPYTEILFRHDVLLPVELMTGASSWYGYPFRAAGAGQLAITGTWGYCAAGTRPPEIKEATLLQAAAMYRKIHMPSKDVAQAMRDPFKYLLDEVRMMLSAYVLEAAPF